MPHLSRDPVTAAAEMVIGLQTMVTRRFDAFDPVVVAVGVFQAGTVHAEIAVRALRRDSRAPRSAAGIRA